MNYEQHKPIFSVIIDAYNYGAYIDDAIVSVLQQTLPKECFEIIVIDDGSTDDTRQRVEKYFPEVIYHYKENGGQASAFNVGIALAQGEFVAFLDADDYWQSGKLKGVLEKFSSDERVDVVYHPLTLVDNARQQMGVFPQWFNQVIAKKPIENYKHWLTVIGSATSGITWRMSALRRLLPIPEEFRICADGYLMIGAPLTAREFGLIDTPYGFYRIHGDNNFSTLGPTDGACQVKSQELGCHYNRLFLQHLVSLADKFDCSGISLIRELTMRCFMDEIFATRQSSGTFRSLLVFWQGRSHLRDLSPKYRLFRVAATFLRMFIPPKVYEMLRILYTKSLLWYFVQRYVKNDNNFIAPSSAVEQL